MRLAAMLAAGLLALSAPLAPAADSQGQFAVRGIGSYDCRTVLGHFNSEDEATRNEARQIYTAWIAGYLTAVNRLSTETFDASPAVFDQPVLALALGHCAKNEALMFEQAVAGLVAALAPLRVVEQSPVADTADDRLALREETVRRVQQRLIDLGLLDGKADGIFGKASEQALRSFQEKHPDSGKDGILDLAAVAAVLSQGAEKAD